MASKKILFITSLHGDEQFGTNVVNEIENSDLSGRFDHIVGNPKAQEQNVRFIDDDLNRVAPGNSDSDSYEKKRASELIELSSNYSVLIDIHGTNANTGVFVLVTNPSLENLLLAASLPIENVVIWASRSSLEFGPVTQFTKCPSIEIECGPKNSEKISLDLKTALTKYLEHGVISFDELMQNIKKQKYYVVEGEKDGLDVGSLEEFKATEIDGKKYYPLMINSYKQGSVRVMRELDLFGKLSY